MYNEIMFYFIFGLLIYLLLIPVGIAIALFWTVVIIGASIIGLIGMIYESGKAIFTNIYPMKKILIVFASLLLFSSCQERSEPKPDIGKVVMYNKMSNNYVDIWYMTTNPVEDSASITFIDDHNARVKLQKSSEIIYVIELYQNK